ncbi:SRPBCC family protein [Oceanibacterium hippocampi]|uniref:Activator of Hsp90 ATPase homologue 1/2-like C-terminal domain-containing protein n=1 Tax=Oceanibacterium hippocampi TaxID=745714 RepID=A0A1Y5S884_9PROT|nr:SRPBCC family protein [Oceanibacterium hippocampi]SLN34574.1 hypothetical protein OCH7691_01343 [Oceanibacterium hippocampi]
MTNKAENMAEGRLDLVLSREIDVPRALVWKAWTEPEHLVRWFAPKPFTTAECEVDLRPGGRFRTVMKAPDGAEFGGDGCILEVVPERRLVFTDTLLPGFRPSPEPFFTAIVEMEDSAGGTRYTATALHKDDADRERHEAMGFHDGWSTCLDQLVALVRDMQEGPK